jgi:3-phenylpropionate/cinnamic acid dioxygenase small subunit
MTVLASDPATDVPEVPIAVSPELQFEIEQFLYFEAKLLDERRYNDWYVLFASDLRYRMPTRANRLLREMDRENSAPGDLAAVDDDKEMLGWRVAQFETGRHWAEDPPSRTRHLVTNVKVQPGELAGEYSVESNFLCYRNRLETEVDIWVGERQDVLRNVGPRKWQIARRYVLLDQNVILSKNLSVFF